MPYSKPKPTANQTAARKSGKKSWQRVGGPKPQWDAEFRASITDPDTGQMVPGGYNEADYNEAAALFANGVGNPTPVGPGNNRYGGGGGYGYGGGGGGGGGGGSAMTQAMFDQMVAALGRQGQQQTYTPLNLPAFQGQNIAAFNAAPYTQAQNSLTQAVAADTANVNRNAQNTTQALNTNYRNDYANATVTPGTSAAPVGVGLGGDSGAANDVNAANGDSQAAFTNLLGVLAANANQSQASRLNQVSMDQGTALNSIGAQNLGLGAGINQARAGAQNQWSQQDNERRYQNSLMQQQWAREQAMQNNQGINATNQANVQQRNQQLQTMLQPILDLIASSGGTKINTASLMALLNQR